MKNDLVQISGVLLTKHSNEEYDYTDKKKELNFHFVVDKPDEVTIIVFDDLLPREKTNEAHLGVLFAESLEEAIEETNYITKENVSEFIMWQ